VLGGRMMSTGSRLVFPVPTQSSSSELSGMPSDVSCTGDEIT
jgi:hypothetical protein